ncbi:nuclear factor 7 [Huso huso]|uniref:Nuclear factor 7 n=1 Tax=Huso huso TaxID=61971 RepID=A0ABR0YCC3_HUSHU
MAWNESTSSLTEELECPVCLDFFKDPVMLDCGHNMCRACILGYMNNQGSVLCPECRAVVSGPGSLKPNRVLRNLADKARELKLTEHLPCELQGPTAPPQGCGFQSPSFETGELCCRKHGEQLKLFCETDRKLVCLICRDERQHKGHTFKPVNEAAQSCKEELNRALQFLLGDNDAVQIVEKDQQTELSRIQDRSGWLLADITTQFAELHEFLRRREEEVKRDLKAAERRALEPMERNLQRIQRELGDRTEQARKLQDSQSITQPVTYLKWWSETGSPIMEELKEKAPCGPATDEWEIVTVSGYESKLKTLSIVPGSLSLGPYETHLQFFIWKEMLKVIRRVPQRLTMEDCSLSLKVSRDGLSTRQIDRDQDQPHKHHHAPPAVVQTEAHFDQGLHAQSREKFTSGSHYWEVEVGGKSDWAVGIKMEKIQERETKWYQKVVHFFSRHNYLLLVFSGDKDFRINAFSVDIPILPGARPRKVGVYLDCEKAQVSFYNADDMSHIYTHSECFAKDIAAYFNPGPYLAGRNAEPLTVCCY